MANITISAVSTGFQVRIEAYPDYNSDMTFTTPFPYFKVNSGGNLFVIYVPDGRGTSVLIPASRLSEIDNINGVPVNYTTVRQLWDGLKTTLAGL
jgi:hypothetical protein